MEMSWCSERGIPHSALLDWENEDRAKLAAFLMESNERCVSCGTADWEWEEDFYAYEAMTMQCRGCFIKEASNEDEKPLGTRVTLVPKRRAQEIRDTPKRLPTRRTED